MPTIRQYNEYKGRPSTRMRPAARFASKPGKPLVLVKPGISAIEFIVETARPGEVTHVSDDDYYNPYLWRNYSDD